MSAAEVCVIGAGSAGIAMCRSLALRDISFDCFERRSAVGGLWRYTPADGPGCAYDSLCPNTSRTVMQYPSLPMPEDYPHYPHHRLVARYFDDYVDHWGVRERIRFGTEVAAVEPLAGGGWEVRLADGATHRYRAVMVASGGRHGEPVYAQLPGTFAGRTLHALDYRDAAELAGRHVLVIGLGATSADVAPEIARVAATTWLSARTGHYVVPKLVLGRPVDETSPLLRRLSPEARRPLLRAMLGIVNGSPTSYGLPKPPYAPGRGPLIATTELLPAIAHGRLTVKPQAVEAEGHCVRFADGSRREFDAIVHCTGYRIAFPFLDARIAVGGDDAPPLYHLAVSPEHPGLYFVGLVHSMTALMPVAEAQAEWIGDLLAGAVRLPERGEMWSTIRRARARQDKRFYDSSGHLLVDPEEYARLIARERRVHAA
ncbi:MAG TPA: NAD(P)-binding domain-containing protein [Conexibacter sp.]|nr:NAD(P)-binding domain-containing protein [Conexibacter sp.]